MAPRTRTGSVTSCHAEPLLDAPDLELPQRTHQHLRTSPMPTALTLADNPVRD
jgi:hypothetical protein